MPRVIGGQGSPLPELKVFRTTQPGVTIGTVAICTRDRISAPTAISMMTSDWSFLAYNENISRTIIQGHVLTLQRNECLGQMEGDWILFIDDDMTWQPDAIRKLISAQRRVDADIIGGLCFQRGEPFQPTLYHKAPSGGYAFREVWPENEIVEVDATGMAFVLITVRALSKISEMWSGQPFPTIEERKAAGAPPPFFRWDDMGEDLRFCEDAKAAGCRIFVDTSIKIGHVGELVITEETFLREVAFRSQADEDTRRRHNEAMGLETMTAEEAAAKVRSMQ